MAANASSIGNALGEQRRIQLSSAGAGQHAATPTGDFARADRAAYNASGVAEVQTSEALVTGDAALAADGTPGLRTTGAVAQAYANALHTVQTMPIIPIFDANDPHQHLLVFLDDGTRNTDNRDAQPIPTSIRQLADLIATIAIA